MVGFPIVQRAEIGLAATPLQAHGPGDATMLDAPDERENSVMRLRPNLPDNVGANAYTTLHDNSTPRDSARHMPILSCHHDKGRRMPPPGVLLIDSDRTYRTELARYLTANGFVTQEFDSFEDALEFLQSNAGHFILMPDLTVHARHLFDIIDDIRRRPNCSVLVLSAQAEETEKIVALELGADDFIAKSTDRREILARIRAAARRFQTGRAGMGAEAQAPSPAASRPWHFLREKRELHDPGGQPVPLTTAEFSLLDTFVAHTGEPLSRDALSLAALGRHYRASDRSIDNLVAKLRRKLGDSAKAARMIKTARPMGYVFTGFNHADESAEVTDIQE